MDFVLATNNKKKIEEMRHIIGLMDKETRLFSLDDFPAFEEAVEDGDTFEANAVKKAEHVARHTGMTAIADDSGLEVYALDGAPGVYSARYAGEPSDDAANNRKLLDELKNVSDDKRGARFVCCIALASKEGIETFTGYVSGVIGRESKGYSGFGYDPLFYPEGGKRTFAEMRDTEKNSISHRAMALRELQKHLLEKSGYIRGF
jgi:XTP/dITP diphosphohydrolase